MQKTTLSPVRIASFAFVLAGAFAIVLLAEPVKSQVRQWAEPVVVRPEIVGVINFHGIPASGFEIRVAQVGESWPPCTSLPVVATSNKAGEFQVPALHKPSFLVDKNKRIPVEVCLGRGELQAEWVSLLLPNEMRVRQYKCDFPDPRDGMLVDFPCYMP